MRISDWSSDVCSSDLGREADTVGAHPALDDLLDPGEGSTTDEQDVRGVDLDELLVGVLAAPLGRDRSGGALDRQSVVSGKSVSVRVDFGGRRIIKKTKIKSNRTRHQKKDIRKE